MISRYLTQVTGVRGEKLREFHDLHLKFFNHAAGSGHNHQAWEGGYKTHLEQCLYIAEKLQYIFKPFFERERKLPYEQVIFDLPVTFESIIMVIYFHDIEKMFKYSGCDMLDFDKTQFLTNTLHNRWGIQLTPEELDAIKYVHGEGDDYAKNKRTMSQLCAICHMADIGSARILFDVKKTL